jgi:hypothetical protein
MDSRDDITVEILRDIRDDVRGTNERVDRLEQRVDRMEQRLDDRIDQLGGHLGSRIDELGRRVVEAELRTTTAVTDMHATLRDVRDILVDGSISAIASSAASATSPISSSA